MRPSLATDRISLGFWLNISFVLNHRGAFRSIIAFAIDLLTSEDRYFLWITAVSLPRRCLPIPTTFQIAHAPCYTRAERPTQSAARVGSSLFDFLTVPSTHYVLKIVFTFSTICHVCKNSIAIYLIIMRDLIFFTLHRPAPAIRHWVFLLVVIVTAGSGTSLVIAQWLEHFTCTIKYVA